MLYDLLRENRVSDSASAMPPQSCTPLTLSPLLFCSALAKHSQLAEPAGGPGTGRRLRQRYRAPHADGVRAGFCPDRQLHARH